jgi:hypothetical protein
MYVFVCVRAFTHTHTHTYAYRHTYIHIHTHTHTHTHTQAPPIPDAVVPADAALLDALVHETIQESSLSVEELSGGGADPKASKKLLTFLMGQVLLHMSKRDLLYSKRDLLYIRLADSKAA